MDKSLKHLNFIIGLADTINYFKTMPFGEQTVTQAELNDLSLSFVDFERDKLKVAYNKMNLLKLNKNSVYSLVFAEIERYVAEYLKDSNLTLDRYIADRQILDRKII